MNKDRTVKELWKSEPTMEGAGVRLYRAFGFYEVPKLDPFLLLDDFHSDDPNDYVKGFPWHPHRGIETVTFMINGEVDHGDSLGNKGAIRSGDVQWMTAGSGIIHQEMPKKYEGMMQGFQLWVNLPRSGKMMEPRYRGITADEIPLVNVSEGVSAKIIAGEMNGTKGPVKDLMVDCEYFDVKMAAGTSFEKKVKAGHTLFVYVYGGEAKFGAGSKPADKGTLVLFDVDGETFRCSSNSGANFLFVSGKPLKEPVAWQGPIVMNTEEELMTAFEEYRNGTFIKSNRSKSTNTINEDCDKYYSNK